MSIKHKRLFYLKSSDRLAGSDASNMNIEIPIPAHETFEHVCVLEMNIPKSYYLIRAAFNTFTLVEAGTNIVVTVPPGNYSVTTWKAAISALLTAASLNNWVYTVSSPTTLLDGKLTYTVTGHTSQPSIVCTTNVFEQLGFARNSTNTFVAGTLRSTNVVKFQAEDTLYLHSDIVGGGLDDVLQQVFTAGVPDFGIINYKCLDFQTMSKPLHPSKSTVFRFSLTNEFDQVMNLNGLDWVCVLMVYTLDKALQLSLG